MHASKGMKWLNAIAIKQAGKDQWVSVEGQVLYLYFNIKFLT
jgi:hypothetical protein